MNSNTVQSINQSSCDSTNHVGISRRAALTGLTTALAGTAFFCLSGCSSVSTDLAKRGSIITSDGTCIAAGQSKSARERYLRGSFACHAAGSCMDNELTTGAEYSQNSLLKRGGDVILTISDYIQTACEDALEGKTGAAVVLDVSSGEILALASSPTFDPSKPPKSTSESAKCMATTNLIPGSTFKTITLAAALEEQIVSPSDNYEVPARLVFPEGYLDNYDATGKTNFTIEDAYAQSCNTFFAELALKLGPERLTKYAEAFGYGKLACQDLTCDASSLSNLQDVSEYYMGWAGIGQSLYDSNGTLHGPETTLVHQTAIAAAVANGGKLHIPHIVKSIEGIDYQASPTILPSQIASPETVQILERCMHAVVESGTGTGAASQKATVSGKTGTAETANGTQDGWFVGFARFLSPADDQKRQTQEDYSGVFVERCYAVGVVVSASSGAESSKAAKTIIDSIC